MTRADTQLKFRIPPDLKPRLEQAARTNKRSINMEVIARLEQSFKTEGHRVRSESGSANLAGKISGFETRLTDVEKELAALQRRVSLVAMAEIRARKDKR
jgi:hypothetical protein